MIDVKTRRVKIEDLELLQLIGRKTFAETFSESNSTENIKNYLTKSFAKEKLTEELNNKNSEFYFGTIENKVIGYLKINSGESQTELKNLKSLEIERIYVSKDFQNKNVWQILYGKAIEIAKQINAEYVWLGVWERNNKAMNFYKKNGFIEFDKHIFRLGEDEQIDVMMKLEL